MSLASCAYTTSVFKVLGQRGWGKRRHRLSHHPSSYLAWSKKIKLKKWRGKLCRPLMPIRWRFSRRRDRPGTTQWCRNDDVKNSGRRRSGGRSTTKHYADSGYTLSTADTYSTGGQGRLGRWYGFFHATLYGNQKKYAYVRLNFFILFLRDPLLHTMKTNDNKKQGAKRRVLSFYVCQPLHGGVIFSNEHKNKFFSSFWPLTEDSFFE